MPNLNDLEQGSDNDVTPPFGFTDALSQKDLNPEYALNANNIMDSLRIGDFSAINATLPAYLTGTIDIVSELPASPVSGTLYVVAGVVDFGSNATVENIGVVGLDVVKVGSDSAIRNALLVSFKELTLGSYISVGDSDFCDTGNGTVFLGSKDKLQSGSNIDIIGSQIVAGGLIDMASDQTRFTQVGVQAGGDLKVGSQLQLSGCPTSSDDNLLIKGDMRTRLVH